MNSNLNAFADRLRCEEDFRGFAQFQLIARLDRQTHRDLDLRGFRPDAVRQQNVRSQSPVVAQLAILIGNLLQITQARHHDVDVLIGILDLDAQILALMILQVVDLGMQWQCRNQPGRDFHNVLVGRRFVGIDDSRCAHLDLLR